VTLVAAFAGSWWAFRLTDRDKARQTVRDRVEAINRAQFVLIHQLNILNNIQTQIINPVREDPARFVNMRPTLPINDASRLDVAALAFLFETEHRELPFHLLVEQRRFDMAVEAMNERARFHVTEIQPRLAAAGIRERTSYDLTEALDEPMLIRLSRSTDDAISHVDLAVTSCSGLITEFDKAMQSLMPGQKFIRAGIAEPSNALPLHPTSGAHPGNPKQA
jgi:hypothetical protein